MKKIIFFGLAILYSSITYAQVSVKSSETKVIVPYKTDLSFPNQQNYLEHWAKTDGLWKIISKQSVEYNENGLVANAEVWPIFGGGPTLRLEFSYNEYNQVIERIKYELKENTFKEVERKLYNYDLNKNLTELQTLYKGEEGYIFANYDQSYRFEYQYTKDNKIQSVASEIFQLAVNSAWLKGSKRVFTYRPDGSLESITRLPYSEDQQDYTQLESTRLSNIRVKDFDFKTFFFSGQIIENLNNFSDFTFEKFDAKTQSYELERTTKYDGTTYISTYQDGSIIERKVNYSPFLSFESAETIKDNIKEDGIIHQYIVRDDGTVKEDQIFHYNSTSQQYEMTEKYIYEKRSTIEFNANSVINVYPNPSNNVTQVNIQIESPAFVTIQVFDISGKLMPNAINSSQQSLAAGNHNFSINRLNEGQYIVAVKINDVTYHQKLVVAY